MANKLTRRSAIAGAAAAGMVGVIPPAVARVYTTGAKTVDDQLNELVDDFYRNAKMIDPSITRAMVYTDETMSSTGRRPIAGIYFERPNGFPLIRRRSGATT
jgi:hypothetical protein